MLGLETQIEVGLQSSATAFSTDRQALNVYKITGGETLSRPEDPLLHGGLANLTDPTEPGPGLPEHKVTVEVPLCINQFPLWLIAFFGPPTTTGASPDYAHAFRSGGGLGYVSIQDRLQVGDYRRHLGCVGEEMKIALDPGADGFARVTMTFVGIREERDITTAAGTVVDAPALDRAAEYLAKVLWNAVAGGQLIGGELTFKRKLKRIRSGDGTGRPSRIEYDGKSALSGSIKLRYTDQTVVADAWARTERTLQMELLRSLGRGLKVLTSHALLDVVPVGRDGPDGVEIDIPLVGYQSASDPALTLTALSGSATLALGQGGGAPANALIIDGEPLLIDGQYVTVDQ